MSTDIQQGTDQRWLTAERTTMTEQSRRRPPDFWPPRHLQDMRADLDAAVLPTAAQRGMLLVGDGALHPGPAAMITGELRIRVHRAASPRAAAVNGAGLAAMSLLRHPAVR